MSPMIELNDLEETLDELGISETQRISTLLAALDDPLAEMVSEEDVDDDD